MFGIIFKRSVVNASVLVSNVLESSIDNAGCDATLAS